MGCPGRWGKMHMLCAAKTGMLMNKDSAAALQEIEQLEPEIQFATEIDSGIIKIVA